MIYHLYIVFYFLLYSIYSIDMMYTDMLYTPLSPPRLLQRLKLDLPRSQLHRFSSHTDVRPLKLLFCFFTQADVHFDEALSVGTQQKPPEIRRFQ